MAILNRLKLKKSEAQKVVDNIQVNPENQRGPVLSSSKSAFLIKQAWVTEKAGDSAGLRKYIFIVDRKINKPEIKKAIEAIYGVKVIDVNIINIKGKAKRLGRSLGKTSAHKKAIVTLKEGQSIDVMPT